MTYMTIARHKGRSAYRAWDGLWYVLLNGESTGEVCETRDAAYAAVHRP